VKLLFLFAGCAPTCDISFTSPGGRVSGYRAAGDACG